TASRGTFGGYRSIATKSCGSGTSGWNVEREDGCSHGLTSTRSSPVIRCQRPSTATPDGTNLTHEEPDAGILLVLGLHRNVAQRPGSGRAAVFHSRCVVVARSGCRAVTARGDGAGRLTRRTSEAPKKPLVARSSGLSVRK